ncbi:MULTISPECIES: pyridoxamine 5'-phosphate oxidase family protein [unclassified Streptomyces]|uniref:pyridoxamine 5'-phosphate oxidase family protein n=1 Tax=unclassified Streptomyces TaxID=2593676 RepID=UPI00362ABE12
MGERVNVEGLLLTTRCLRLLAAARVGRIVHTHHALPAALPVPFCLDADFTVVVRTSAESRLAGAIDRAVVAFQADEVDPAERSGWSVVVTGRATAVTDPAEHRRLSRTGPCSWRASCHDIFFRIEPELITGSELGARRVLHDARRMS